MQWRGFSRCSGRLHFRLGPAVRFTSAKMALLAVVLGIDEWRYSDAVISFTSTTSKCHAKTDEDRRLIPTECRSQSECERQDSHDRIGGRRQSSNIAVPSRRRPSDTFHLSLVRPPQRGLPALQSGIFLPLQPFGRSANGRAATLAVNGLFSLKAAPVCRTTSSDSCTTLSTYKVADKGPAVCPTRLSPPAKGKASLSAEC
jgi:hypothetical protein